MFSTKAIYLFDFVTRCDKGPMTKFPFILKETRLQRSMSQSDLARLLGVARSTVSSYENGSRSPDKETLIRIAHCLQVSVDYLLGNDNLTRNYSQNYSGILNNINDLLISSKISQENKNAILKEVKDYFRWKLQQAEQNQTSEKE